MVYGIWIFQGRQRKLDLRKTRSASRQFGADKSVVTDPFHLQTTTSISCAIRPCLWPMKENRLENDVWFPKLDLFVTVLIEVVGFTL
ncbi:hypothetical protein AJ87_15110 [Rhizobium yanglingense]|nr:hypothetical protein AJ87_15110 [Rhizobium yanglingense]